MQIKEIPTDRKTTVGLTVSGIEPLVEPYDAVFQVRYCKAIGVVEGMAVVKPEFKGQGKTGALVRPHIGKNCSAWVYTRPHDISGVPGTDARAIERPTSGWGLGPEAAIEPVLEDGLVGIFYELHSNV